MDDLRIFLHERWNRGVHLLPDTDGFISFQELNSPQMNPRRLPPPCAFTTFGSVYIIAVHHLVLSEIGRKDCKKSAIIQTYFYSLSPWEAPPGTGQRAEYGSKGQSGEERVKRKVEQSLHPIIAQAFQRVNVVLKENGQIYQSRFKNW